MHWYGQCLRAQELAYVVGSWQLEWAPCDGGRRPLHLASADGGQRVMVLAHMVDGSLVEHIGELGASELGNASDAQPWAESAQALEEWALDVVAQNEIGHTGLLKVKGGLAPRVGKR